jgi:hypothetical protein
VIAIRDLRTLRHSVKFRSQIASADNSMHDDGRPWMSRSGP